MEQTAPKPQLENTPAAPAISAEERLARIEKGVEELRQLAARENRKEVQDKKKTSRSAVTVAFALLGMKIGAVFAKMFFLKDSWQEFNKEKIYEDFLKEHGNKPVAERAWEGTNLLLKHAYQEKNIWVKLGFKALIAGGIGAAIGAMIGWARGDRINDVHDLIKHPIDSLRKIIGLKVEETKTEIPDAASKPTQATVSKVAEAPQVVVEKERPIALWQDKVAAEQTQQEEAAVVAGAAI